MNLSNPSNVTYPKRYLTPKPLKCGFCSMRAGFRCMYPRCTTVFCKKHGTVNEEGCYCRDHKPGII